MANKKSGQYTVEAQVCDIIKSVPVTKSQADKMMRETKKKVPGAKVKITKVK